MKKFFVYNLFQRLYGDINNWYTPALRAALMGFNWVYINPIHYPGFSGSLYAPKDYYLFNPLFFGKRNKEESYRSLKEWVEFCNKNGLQVMVDLVINHTAIDAHIVKEHKEWYKKDESGKIKHPRAKDGEGWVEWGDLAELDYRQEGNKEELWEYIFNLVKWFIELGIQGFRCDAAYQIPQEFWLYLIDKVKKIDNKAIFWAESLGCEFDEVMVLCKSGFDYVMESSKWWDFEAKWCIPQHNKFVGLAHSVAFPENHDTERLMTELKDRTDLVKMRYIFSAFIAEGIMITSGFEYGFKKRCNVLYQMPGDREPTRFYLVDFIKKVNNLKENNKIFMNEVEIEQYEFLEVLCLIKKLGDQEAMFIINRSKKDIFNVPIKKLKTIMRYFNKAYDPFNNPLIVENNIVLKPEAYHLFIVS
ncbi:MAG: alpha-amylase family glycosyl hydrolase [Candidatus Hydrogenedentota bacterium]